LQIYSSGTKIVFVKAQMFKSEVTLASAVTAMDEDFLDALDLQ